MRPNLPMTDGRMGYPAVSPELCLVDPELRRVASLLAEREIAPTVEAVQLPQRARASALRTVLRVAADRVSSSFLFVSVVVNLVFVGTILAGDVDSPSLEPSTASVARLTKAEAERAVLALVQLRDQPAAKLFDETTGLLRNNVQAVCTPGAGAFLCTVTPPGDASGQTLRLRYRRLADGSEHVQLLGDAGAANR